MSQDKNKGTKLGSFMSENKIIKRSSLDDVASNAESTKFVSSKSKRNQRFVPKIDYSNPEEFAKFGSAESYYIDSIERVYKTYPYDGSLYEQEEWLLSSSFLDLYLFNNLYPKVVGSFDFSTADWGDLVDEGKSGNYGKSKNPEYITVFGGPTTGDIYSETYNRDSSLKFDPVRGNTIELWIKKDNFVPSDKTEREVIFDCYSKNSTSMETKARITLELDTTAGSDCLMITYMSGAIDAGVPILKGINQVIQGSDKSKIVDGNWHHLAISLYNTGDDLRYDFYIDGARESTKTIANQSLGTSNRNMIATIGALATPDVVNSTGELGSGHLSASIDEFRFWKSKRDEKQIGRYFQQEVNGGTDSDHTNSSLGVYFKFNEGSNLTQPIVLDYSGRAKNGTITNYKQEMRNPQSAINSSPFTEMSEKPDPVMFPTDQSVVDLIEHMRKKGLSHDLENASLLKNTTPSFMLEEDHGNHLKNLIQTISSYFDEADAYISHLPQLKALKYDDISNVSTSNKFSTDCFDDSEKTIARRSAQYHDPTTVSLISHFHDGKEIFANAEVIEQFLGRTEGSVRFENSLYDIRDFIVQNIYNNLTHIYKKKGTEQSFRNLIRCFGVDDELIKLNVYLNNGEFKINDDSHYTTYRAKTLSMSHQDNRNITLSQVISSENPSISKNFIPAPPPPTVPSVTSDIRFGLTAEANIVFPRLLDKSHINYTRLGFTESSLFGFGQSDRTAVVAHKSLYVSVVKDTENSPDARFQLFEPGNNTPILTSELIPDVYSNSTWNISLRVRNPIDHLHGIISGTASKPYEIVLSGYNYSLDELQNSFSVSINDYTFRDEFIQNDKEFFLGARRANVYNGNVETKTDVRFINCTLWQDALDDEELMVHAKNPSNIGRINSFKNINVHTTSLDDFDIKREDTKILHWDFNNAQESSGEIKIDDISHGSSERIANNGAMGAIVGFDYPAITVGVGNLEKAIKQDFIVITKFSTIENVHASDQIQILDADRENFNTSSRPETFSFSFEKSMSATISDEIIKYFGSLSEFNNLIGEPVHKYRHGYKGLEKLRAKFFDKVSNEIDYDRFITFFRWIDESLSKFLNQLKPYSSQFTGDLSNVVESHILERNKYHHKFPTLEMKLDDPESPMLGVNELLYDWEHGHAPPGSRRTIYNFEDSIVDQLPAGWTAQNDNPAEGGGAVVRHRDPADTTTNKALVIRGEVVHFDNVQDPPHALGGANRNYRWVILERAFQGPLLVQFKAYQGRPGGDYGTNDTTENDELFLQYKVGSGQWQNTGGPLIAGQSPSGGNWNLSSVVTREINEHSPISLRWIHRTNAGTDLDENDLWVIDDIQIIATSEAHHCLWWADRAEGNKEFTYANDIGDTREYLRKMQNKQAKGSTYVFRKLSRPYKYSVDNQPIYKGGQYRDSYKIDDYYKVVTQFASVSKIQLLKTDIAPETSCQDVLNPQNKTEITGQTTVTGLGGYYNVDSDLSFPFTMVSSSVADMFPSIHSNILVTNNHLDQYGDDYEIPLQSPFTERFVGGMPHRHQDMNRDATEDLSAKRPEAYNLVENTDTSITLEARTPSEAASRYYRDGLTKRPVNIANIKFTKDSKFIGNYNKDYEVVMVNGRSLNNNDFVDNEGFDLQNLQSAYVADLVEPELPINKTSIVDSNKKMRTRTEHVIVNRFSSPGGPETSIDSVSTDFESSEFSPYNTINYRNLNVRRILNSLHSEKSNQFGIRPIASAGGHEMASLHMTNRNSIVDFGVNGTTIFNNKAILFDGSDDYLQIDNTAPIFRNQNSFSIFAWIKHPEVSNLHHHNIFSVTFNNGKNRILFALKGTKDADGITDGQLFVYTNDTDKHYKGSNLRVDDDKWHLVGITYRAADHRVFFYIDGVLQGSQLVGKMNQLFPDNCRISIGQEWDDNPLRVSGFFNGYIAEFAAWNTILTDGQVKEVYSDNSFLGPRDLNLLSTKSNLQVWYRMGEGTSGLIPDSTTVGTGNIFNMSNVTKNNAAHYHATPVGTLVSSIKDRSSDTSVAQLPGLQWTTNMTVDHDNFLVSHPIPQNDIQYSWITRSSDETIFTFPGYANNFTIPRESAGSTFPDQIEFIGDAPIENITENLDFVDSNRIIQDKQIDVTTNTYYHELVSDWESSTGSVAGTNPLEKVPEFSLNARIITRQGPYGHPSWKQIRGYQNPIVRQLRKQNIYSYSFRSGIHSPNAEVDSYKLTFRNPEAGKRRASRKVKNYKEIPVTTRFKPLFLMDYDDFILRDVVKTYDTFAGTSPQKYEEAFWTQTNLDQIPPSGSNLRERLFFLMKDSYANELTSYSNMQIPSVLEIKEKELSSFDSVLEEFSKLENAPPTFFRQMSYIETVYPKESVTFSLETKNRNNFVFRYKKLHSERRENLSDSNVYDDYSHDENSASEVHFNNPGFKKITVNKTNIDKTNSMFVDAVDIVGSDLQHISQSSWPLDSRENFTTTMPTCLTMSFVGDKNADFISGGRDQANRYEGELQNDYSIYHMGINKLHGMPPSALVYNRRVPQTFSEANSGPFTGEYLTGEAQWQTAEQSNSSPSEDSYEEYSKNIKLAGRGYSLVPEFRISEHIYKIIEENTGRLTKQKFNQPLENIFTLEGATHSQDPEENFDLSIGGQFYKTYATSDFLKYFSVLDDSFQEKGISAFPSRVSLKCSAVMKFLPYEGFYPVERTEQIGNIFARNYLANFEYRQTDGVDISNSLDKKISGSLGQAIKPLMSPGILYNSIKSGLAVDYPIFYNLGSSSPSTMIMFINFKDDTPVGTRPWTQTSGLPRGDTVTISSRARQILKLDNDYWYEEVFDSSPVADNRSHGPGMPVKLTHRITTPDASGQPDNYNRYWPFAESRAATTAGSRYEGFRTIVSSEIYPSQELIDIAENAGGSVNDVSNDDAYWEQPGPTQARMDQEYFFQHWLPEETNGETTSQSQMRYGTTVYPGFQAKILNEDKTHTTVNFRFMPNPVWAFINSEDWSFMDREKLGNIRINQTSVQNEGGRPVLDEFGQFQAPLPEDLGYIESVDGQGYYRNIWMNISDRNRNELDFDTTDPNFALAAFLDEFDTFIFAWMQFLAYGIDTYNFYKDTQGYDLVNKYPLNYLLPSGNTKRLIPAPYTDRQLNYLRNSAGSELGQQFMDLCILIIQVMAEDTAGRTIKSVIQNRGQNEDAGITSENVIGVLLVILFPMISMLTKSFHSLLMGHDSNSVDMSNGHLWFLMVSGVYPVVPGGLGKFLNGTAPNVDTAYQNMNPDNTGVIFGFSQEHLGSDGNMPVVSLPGELSDAIDQNQWGLGDDGLAPAPAQPIFFSETDDGYSNTSGTGNNAPLNSMVTFYEGFQGGSGEGATNTDILRRVINPMSSSAELVQFGSITSGTGITGSFLNGTEDNHIPRIKAALYRRIPFENLLNPRSMFKTALYDNEPHPSAALFYGNFENFKTFDYPPSFGSVNFEHSAGSLGVVDFTQNTDYTPFKLAMNNFAAETVNFFLEDRRLTTLESSDVDFVGDGKLLKMRVYVKNKNTVVYDRKSAFGPPVNAGVFEQEVRTQKEQLVGDPGVKASGFVDFNETQLDGHTTVNANMETSPEAEHDMTPRLRIKDVEENTINIRYYDPQNFYDTTQASASLSFGATSSTTSSADTVATAAVSSESGLHGFSITDTVMDSNDVATAIGPNNLAIKYYDSNNFVGPTLSHTRTIDSDQFATADFSLSNAGSVVNSSNNPSELHSFILEDANSNEMQISYYDPTDYLTDVLVHNETTLGTTGSFTEGTPGTTGSFVEGTPGTTGSFTEGTPGTTGSLGEAGTPVTVRPVPGTAAVPFNSTLTFKDYSTIVSGDADATGGYCVFDSNSSNSFQTASCTANSNTTGPETTRNSSQGNHFRLGLPGFSIRRPSNSTSASKNISITYYDSSHFQTTISTSSSSSSSSSGGTKAFVELIFRLRDLNGIVMPVNPGDPEPPEVWSRAAMDPTFPASSTSGGRINGPALVLQRLKNNNSTVTEEITVWFFNAKSTQPTLEYDDVENKPITFQRLDNILPAYKQTSGTLQSSAGTYGVSLTEDFSSGGFDFFKNSALVDALVLCLDDAGFNVDVLGTIPTNTGLDGPGNFDNSTNQPGEPIRIRIEQPFVGAAGNSMISEIPSGKMGTESDPADERLNIFQPPNNNPSNSSLANFTLGSAGSAFRDSLPLQFGSGANSTTTTTNSSTASLKDYKNAIITEPIALPPAGGGSQSGRVQYIDVFEKSAEEIASATAAAINLDPDMSSIFTAVSNGADVKIQSDNDQIDGGGNNVWGIIDRTNQGGFSAPPFFDKLVTQSSAAAFTGGSAAVAEGIKVSYSTNPLNGETVVLSSNNVTKTYQFTSDSSFSNGDLISPSNNIAVIIGAKGDNTWTNFLTAVESSNGHGSAAVNVSTASMSNNTNAGHITLRNVNGHQVSFSYNPGTLGTVGTPSTPGEFTPGTPSTPGEFTPGTPSTPGEFTPGTHATVTSHKRIELSETAPRSSADHAMINAREELFSNTGANLTGITNINGTTSTDASVLKLTGNALSSEIDDDPTFSIHAVTDQQRTDTSNYLSADSSSKWGGFKLQNTVQTPIVVEFEHISPSSNNTTAGDNPKSFGITDKPESIFAGDVVATSPGQINHLWVQWSTDGTNWNTGLEIYNPKTNLWTKTGFAVNSDLDVNDGTDIHIRFLCNIQGGVDHWGVRNLVVSKANADKSDNDLATETRTAVSGNSSLGITPSGSTTEIILTQDTTGVEGETTIPHPGSGLQPIVSSVAPTAFSGGTTSESPITTTRNELLQSIPTDSDNTKHIDIRRELVNLDFQASTSVPAEISNLGNATRCRIISHATNGQNILALDKNRVARSGSHGIPDLPSYSLLATDEQNDLMVNFSGNTLISGAQLDNGGAGFMGPLIVKFDFAHNGGSLLDGASAFGTNGSDHPETFLDNRGTGSQQNFGGHSAHHDGFFVQWSTDGTSWTTGIELAPKEEYSDSWSTGGFKIDSTDSTIQIRFIAISNQPAQGKEVWAINNLLISEASHLKTGKQVATSTNSVINSFYENHNDSITSAQTADPNGSKITMTQKGSGPIGNINISELGKGITSLVEEATSEITFSGGSKTFIAPTARSGVSEAFVSVRDDAGNLDVASNMIEKTKTAITSLEPAYTFTETGRRLTIFQTDVGTAGNEGNLNKLSPRNANNTNDIEKVFDTSTNNATDGGYRFAGGVDSTEESVTFYYEVTKENVTGSGHAPYTPPFLDPDSEPYIEFSIAPKEGKRYAWEDVVNEVETTYVNFKSRPSNSQDSENTNENFKYAMNLEASLDWYASYVVPITSFEYSEANSDTIVQIRKPEEEKYKRRWVIQTKWETPIIDFSDSLVSASFISGGIQHATSTYGSPWQPERWNNFLTSTINMEQKEFLTGSRGIWHQYGVEPLDQKGYYLEIADVDEPDVGSLATIVGFKSGDESSKTEKIGKISESREISEAVVAVPYYTDNNNNIKFFNLDKSKIFHAVQENKKIQKELLSPPTPSERDKTKEEVKEMRLIRYNNLYSQPSNPVAYQMRMMERYIFPPQFDFITFPEKIDNEEAVAMYVFEFKAKLNKQDLINIWQNVRPTSSQSCVTAQHSSVLGERPENILDTEYISHELGSRMESLLDNDFLKEKVRWMVFKVKRRAEADYSKIKINSAFETLESENFIPQNWKEKLSTFRRDRELRDIGYSYNWPYDFFSLVELIKVESKVDFKLRDSGIS